MSSAHSSAVRRGWNPFPLRIWIAWLAATVSAAITIVIFLYQNFETKQSFDDYKIDQVRFQEEIIKRLDRLDNKLDQWMIQKKN